MHVCTYVYMCGSLIAYCLHITLSIDEKAKQASMPCVCHHDSIKIARPLLAFMNSKCHMVNTVAPQTPEIMPPCRPKAVCVGNPQINTLWI